MIGAFFLVLILAQVSLGISAESSNKNVEGEMVGNELFLYAHGTIKLRAVITQGISASLLINGQAAQNITSVEISVNVKEGDYLSILAKADSSNSASISSSDWNLSIECQGISLKTSLGTQPGIYQFLIHKGINTLGVIG